MRLMQQFKATNEDAGKTILQFLKKKLPIAFVYRIFRKKDVKINGKKAKKTDLLKGDDEITVYGELKELERKTNPLDIIFENDDFLILNKPKGIAVHEGNTVSFQDSLLRTLIEHYEAQGVTPFLVHRLDTNTSGCLIVAKKKSVLAMFQKLFKEHEVKKEYVLLLKGVIKQEGGTISSPLEGRNKEIVDAMTTYKVVQNFEEAGTCLVSAQPKTGRKHQLRIHFASIAHPVIMDQQYGDFEENHRWKKAYGLKSQMLHASRISFDWKRERIEVQAKLPEEFSRMLKKLKKD